jgi:hypothetical protein
MMVRDAMRGFFVHTLAGWSANELMRMPSSMMVADSIIISEKTIENNIYQ